MENTKSDFVFFNLHTYLRIIYKYLNVFFIFCWKNDQYTYMPLLMFYTYLYAWLYTFVLIKKMRRNLFFVFVVFILNLFLFFYLYMHFYVFLIFLSIMYICKYVVCMYVFIILGIFIIIAKLTQHISYKKENKNAKTKIIKIKNENTRRSK